MFNYINPTFPLFGLNISWYAVCILIGVIIAVILGLKEGRRLGVSSDSILGRKADFKFKEMSSSQLKSLNQI